MRKLAFILFVVFGLSASAAQKKTLDFYFIDTEGGQATLMVTPSGESLLVDAGWPGNDGRDAKRIIAAAQKAGVQQIDYLLVTHYHMDHVGGVAELTSRFPVKTLIDHGDNTETDKGGQNMTAIYKKGLESAKRLTVRPGDLIPLKNVRIEVVAARGVCIEKALSGAGKPNPLCGQEAKKADDPTENARSIGIVGTYGKFRFVDLGDLTWNKEFELACPTNKVGAIDLYLTTHHGMNMSGSKTIVHALHPRVAIMNNGAKKGGSPDAWRIVSSSPGLEDLWQLHFALAGGKDNNVPEERIANPDGPDAGHYLAVEASKNRSMKVTNSRTGFSKSYPAR